MTAELTVAVFIIYKNMNLLCAKQVLKYIFQWRRMKFERFVSLLSRLTQALILKNVVGRYSCNLCVYLDDTVVKVTNMYREEFQTFLNGRVAGK